MCGYVGWNSKARRTVLGTEGCLARGMGISPPAGLHGQSPEIRHVLGGCCAGLGRGMRCVLRGWGEGMGGGRYWKACGGAGGGRGSVRRGAVPRTLFGGGALTTGTGWSGWFAGLPPAA